MAYSDILWKHDYSINVKEIDNQHKHLVEIVNKFNKALAEGHENDVLKQTLVDLVEYTHVHFNYEEEHMRSHKYFGFSEHKRQHEVLIKKIVESLNHFKQGKIQATDELTGLLKTWLIKHIIDHDKQYGNFLGG